MLFIIIRNRVTDRDFVKLEWAGWHNITRIVALDQTNGTGGIVFQTFGGIGQNFVHLYLESIMLDSKIDFIVNIFGEPPHSNDYVIGNITHLSVLLYS